MRAECVAFLLLFLNALGSCHQKRDLTCRQEGVNEAANCGPYNMSAYAVDPFRAFVSWWPSQLVEHAFFRMAVFIDEAGGNQRVHSAEVFEETGKVTSRHSVLVTNLLPWKYYLVKLEGCSREYCSNAGNATFSTPPETVPAPIFTRVEATGSTSFKVAWQFPQHDLRLFDGFRVTYGSKNEPSRFVVYTKEHNLTVGSLKAETTIEIEVAAKYKDTDGRPVQGPKGSASVTTWTNLPVVDIEYEADIPDGIGTTLVSWKCINSSVNYFQYRINEYDQWTACNGSSECDVTFKYGRNETLTGGYLRMTHRRVKVELRPALVEFVRNRPSPGSIRGCNSHGCGEEIFVTTHAVLKVPGPSSLSGVTATLKENTAVLRWNPPDPSGYEGMEVTWNCNSSKSANRLSQFDIDSSYDNTKEVLIEGLPSNAEHCEFNISAYKDRDQRRRYSLPVRAIAE